MIVNKKMKNKLTQANIDPYSSEGRSEIYCRFVLENPRDLASIQIINISAQVICYIRSQQQTLNLRI